MIKFWRQPYHYFHLLAADTAMFSLELIIPHYRGNISWRGLPEINKTLGSGWCAIVLAWCEHCMVFFPNLILQLALIRDFWKSDTLLSCGVTLCKSPEFSMQLFLLSLLLWLQLCHLPEVTPLYPQLRESTRFCPVLPSCTIPWERCWVGKLGQLRTYLVSYFPRITALPCLCLP